MAQRKSALRLSHEHTKRHKNAFKNNTEGILNTYQSRIADFFFKKKPRNV